MSRDDILTKVNLLERIPVAIQALSDGDTFGWFIEFSAITDDLQCYPLGALSGGGDIRVFTGEVPPWPEAAAAQRLGAELAERLGAEFYFPSPHHPEDECPGWRERDKGHPCRRCGILLLQSPESPRYGPCCSCCGEEERERREADWTPEQRRCPRCYLCGNPATDELKGMHVCAACAASYEIQACTECGSEALTMKSHTLLCGSCQIRPLVESITPSQRDSIRDAAARGLIAAIGLVRELVGCSLNDAQRILVELARRCRRAELWVVRR